MCKRLSEDKSKTKNALRFWQRSGDLSPDLAPEYPLKRKETRIKTKVGKKKNISIEITKIGIKMKNGRGETAEVENNILYGLSVVVLNFHGFVSVF